MRIARRKYGTHRYPEETFDVHFHYLSIHIAEHYCNAELDDVLYDEGVYFTKPYVRGQTLSLYTHFVSKMTPERAVSRVQIPRLGHWN